MSDLSWYLPTEARARERGVPLPPGEPSERHPLVALVVRAEVLRRTWWDETAPRGRNASLPSRPPEPTTMVDAVHRTLLQGADGSDVVRHYVDTVVKMHEVYVPSALGHVPHMFSFESALESLIAPEPPECLRCHDFSPRAQTAYRGGGSNKPPDFHGYKFEDTIEKAGAAVAAIAPRGRVVRGEVRAWAWPFLWLRYGGESPREVALLVDAHQGLHLYSGALPQE